jgi:hypothetical protein
VKDDEDVNTLSTCGIPCECGTAYVADGKVVTYCAHNNSLFQEKGS